MKIKRRNSFINVSILIIISIIIEIILLKLWKFNLKVPYIYHGSDELLTLSFLKNSEFNIGLFNKNIAMPFGTNMMDFMITQNEKVSYFIHNIFKILTGNTVVAINIQNLLIPPTIAVISYFVMKNLGVRNLISICGSLVYAFLPFLFLRMYSHFFLASYYFVPISVMLCFWLLEDDNFFKANGFLKYKRNLLAIIFCFLIVNNGNSYYSFFTAIIFGITGISLAFKNKNIKKAFPAMGLCFTLAIILAINQLPHLFYNIMHEGVDIGKRSVGDTVRYGLKISNLLIPTSVYRYYSNKAIWQEYINFPFIAVEGIYENIGIFGIIGFFIALIFMIVKRKTNKIDNRRTLLSEILIFLLLFTSVFGFSFIFSALITPQIRCWNRVSVFIAYISILSLCLTLNEYSKKDHKLLDIGIVALSLISILESFPGNIQNYEYCKSLWENDKKFIGEIENIVPEKSMIFQLPYHAFPESGPVNNMNDYSLMVGYIHSNKLRWSYGGMRGRRSDLWNQKISSLPLKEMVDKICLAGFNGIYIDRRAYTEQELQSLEYDLSLLLQQKPLESDNKLLCFFDIQEYRDALKSDLGDKEFEKEQQEILNTVQGGI